MKKSFALTIAGAVTLAVAAVPTAASAQTPTDPSIAEIAAGDPNFSTLLTAVSAAGLADALADCDADPITVFAPTNAAFEKVPADLLQGALDDPDGLLTSILQYHVVPGTNLAADVVAATSLTTLLGQDIAVDGTVLNGSVNITATDIPACNGVVHVIDAVLVPTLPSIADIAGGDDFTTLLAAVQAAGLAEALADCSADPITVFAPTDAAFAAALEALGLTAEDVLGDTELLTTILTYHVVPGIAAAAEVLESGQLTTLQGEDISVSETGAVLNGDVNIIGTDNWACNGVVHVIDAVLLPPSLTEPAPTTTVAPTTTTPATELPATGNETTVMVLIASVLLLGGVALVATRRRSTV